jgi:hypothetical protein
MRKAVAWLASQVGPDGKPAGLDGVAAVGAAKWMHAALATTHSEVGKAATGKLATFLASPQGKSPEGKPADHLWTATVTAGKDEAEAANSTASLLGSLAAGRGTNPGDFDRLLEALPTVLTDVAARFPELKLAAKDVAPGAWAKSVSASLLATLHAPAGFEEATPRNLANATRALSICADHLPKRGDGESPKAPPLAGTPRKVEGDLKAAYQEAATAGLAFLEAQQKNGRFGFMGHEDAGVTALALSAAIRTARRLEKPLPPWADQGLDWLVSLQKKNGAIHSGGLAVYTTSAAVMALADGGRAKDLPVVQKAATFLKVAQLDEGEGYDKGSDWGYGGIGYDGNELRADLSNTQFGMEALHDGGVPADDEAMQRAIVFLQRCQNNPEFNPKPFEREDGQIVKSGTDGGSGYAPGESKAGLIPNGDGTFTSRSYGSMTYGLEDRRPAREGGAELDRRALDRRPEPRLRPEERAQRRVPGALLLLVHDGEGARRERPDRAHHRGRREARVARRAAEEAARHFDERGLLDQREERPLDGGVPRPRVELRPDRDGPLPRREESRPVIRRRGATPAPRAAIGPRSTRSGP